MKTCSNFDLTKYNSYNIKAFCKTAFFPTSEDDLYYIYTHNTSVKKIILGNGNNIILSKNWYEDEFIILNECFENTNVVSNIVVAEAGATMLKLSKKALDHSLSGFEIFYDIPSSVGGAVVMNAGTSGEEIKDLIIKVHYLNLADMQIKEITRDEIGFEYRNSFFQKNTDNIVLKAWFKLTKGNPKDIKNKMEDIKQIRWSKQPREYPNCGSVFKRPKGCFVGPMIEELGLKGYSIGGAKISEKHAGFIINFNNATGKNILELIINVKEKVKAAYGIDLEVEQRII